MAEPSEDLARRRWMVMQTMRIMGFALAIIGILLLSGSLDFAGEYSTLLGYAFLAMGLLDGFVMPRLLARRWRTPRP